MNNFFFLSNTFRNFLFTMAFLAVGVGVSAQIQISLDLQGPSCHGYTNGQATASVSGGQAPYVYQWSSPNASNNVTWGLTAGGYSLTVTDANGASKTEGFSIQEPDVLVANVQPQGDACSSTSFLATATGGTMAYSYAWNTGETGNMVNVSGAMNLEVNVTDAAGCTANAVYAVTNPLTLDSFKVTDISCNNYHDGMAIPYVSGGQAPYTYAWSNDSTESFISSLEAGTYSVTITDAAGCFVTASGTVVNPPDHQVDVTIDPACGAPATVTVTAADGVGPYTFMWLFDGNLEQINHNTYTSVFEDFPQGTAYLCVMNANHCPHDVWVTVAPGFELNLNSVVDADCAGNGGSIDIAPTSVVGPMEYAWTGPNGFTADTEDISGLAPGVYNVTATDAGGCTATYTVTVGSAGQMVADFDFTVVNCDNNVLDIEFNATPAGATSYEWSFGDNGQSVNHNFSSNPGDVTLTVSDGNGCTSTVTKNIDRDVVDVTMPEDLTACVGTGDVSIGIQNNNGSNLTYSWTPTSMIASGANTANPVLLNNASVAGNTTLNVVITNESGCVVNESVDYNVSDPAAFSIDMSNVSFRQCNGQICTFSNTDANADNFSWVFPDGTTVSGADAEFDFQSYDQGTYTVMLVPNDQTCVDPIPYEVTVGQPAVAAFDFAFIGCLDSIAFVDNSTTPNPIVDWTWEFPTVFKNQNPTIPADVVNSEDFLARLTILFGDGCSLTVEQNVDIELVESNIPEQLVICGEEGVHLNPGGNPDYQYTWSPATGLDDPNSPNPLANPSSTQTYTVDIVNPNGSDNCSVTDQVEVVVAPVTGAAQEDVTVCDNTTAVPISVSHVGGDATWYDDGAMTNEIGAGDMINVTAGTYFVEVVNAEGCSFIDTVVVEANPMSVVLVQNDFLMCDGTDVSLEVADLAADDTDPQWYLDGNLIGTGNPFSVSPTGDSDYTVVVANADGCEGTATAHVTVSDAVVSTTASEMSIYQSQTTDLGASDGFVTYEWSPNDGTLDDIYAQNPTATPMVTTTYTVTATDANGCTAESSITIEVQETACAEPFIYLPNAFSPNGDGNGNDILYLHGLNLDEIHLSIYNRWGQQVFDTRDQNYGWDGTFNGEPVVPDVYGFYLRVKCSNGEEYFKKGNISVLK